MTLDVLMVTAAALVGVGVYGALSQQSFVMIMMGIELIINGALLAAVTVWAFSTGGSPKGQMLGVVVLTVMAVEAALGFTVMVNIYRVRKADITEKTKRLRG
ncbi:MAG: NADH-quinone oxidoreductase subunit NuoK [Egibacteraceae bacterium]